MASVQAELPHNFNAIVEDADSEIDKYPEDKLNDEVNSGAFVNQNTKDCYFLFVKDLKFVQGEWELYKWHGLVEVAELIKGPFEVNGVFKGKNQENLVAGLPGTSLKASFIILLKKEAAGWKDPVNLTLILPDGTTIGRSAPLNKLKPDRWIELSVANFKYPIHQLEGTKIFMSGSGPKGLVLLGAQIRRRLITEA